MEQFVTFQIEDEEYGVDILKVIEIKGYEESNNLPNSPDYINGIISMRGDIIPIIDLRKKFNMKEIEYNKFNVYLILKIKGRTVGFIVDSVKDVVDLEDEDIQETPNISSKINTEFIKGIGNKDDDDIIILLELDKILELEEVTQIDNIV